MVTLRPFCAQHSSLTLETHIAGGVTKHEPEVDVDHVSITVEQNIPVMPVFDL